MHHQVWFIASFLRHALFLEVGCRRAPCHLITSSPLMGWLKPTFLILIKVTNLLIIEEVLYLLIFFIPSDFLIALLLHLFLSISFLIQYLLLI